MRAGVTSTSAAPQLGAAPGRYDAELCGAAGAALVTALAVSSAIKAAHRRTVCPT